MSQIPFTPPSYKSRAFNCPQCHAFANQIWGDAHALYSGYAAIAGVAFSHCTHCNKDSIWHSGTLIYPDASQAPLLNPDLPADIKIDYEEARKIINRSPRGQLLSYVCAFRSYVHTLVKVERTSMQISLRL